MTGELVEAERVRSIVGPHGVQLLWVRSRRGHLRRSARVRVDRRRTWSHAGTT